MQSARQLISVVTPCFNEELNIEECYSTIRRIFEQDLPGYDYEHLFCDNASSDRTLDILRGLAAADPNVRVIANARNFGPFHSLFNGIINTQGDAVVLFLAADLQDPPELIPRFVRLWEQGYEVAYGRRIRREEGLIMRTIRRVYYRLTAKLAFIDLKPGVGEFQLVDRKVVESLRQFEDFYPYIRGMVAYCGFRTVGIDYTWRSRKRGFSKNSFFRLIDQGLNGVISFTKLPMRICMAVGLVVAVLSIAYAILTFAISLIYFRQLSAPGIQTLIVAVFFFSGLQLFFFGVLGEYISSIHLQVRKRPLVVERERINFTDDRERRVEPPRRLVDDHGVVPTEVVESIDPAS
jgi:glycosyltransferase involved in cell wall biosynthesis